MISLIYGIKKTKANSQTQRTFWWLPEGKGVGGWTKWAMEVKYMVMDQTFGGEHFVMNTNAEL